MNYTITTTVTGEKFRRSHKKKGRPSRGYYCTLVICGTDRENPRIEKTKDFADQRQAYAAAKLREIEIMRAG